MYPPKAIANIQEAVSALWESLCRAGDHWSVEALLLNEQDGKTKVVLYLTSPLPAPARKSVSGYIKEYLLLAGHSVQRVKITRSYVELTVSNP